MTAHKHKGLDSGNTWRIEFDFQKGFGSVGEEFGQGLGEGDERGMVARLEGTPNSTPAPGQYADGDKSDASNVHGIRENLRIKRSVIIFVPPAGSRGHIHLFVDHVNAGILPCEVQLDQMIL